jgi:hypothetical protein
LLSFTVQVPEKFTIYRVLNNTCGAQHHSTAGILTGEMKQNIHKNKYKKNYLYTKIKTTGGDVLKSIIDEVVELDGPDV